MKTMETTVEAYEAPKVKVIEVEVEQGFAVSDGDATGGGNDYNPG